MDEFLAASLSFPTVVFTVLLLVAVGYWLLVILGTIGLDVLDFDHGGGEAAGADAGGHVDLDHGADGHGADGHDAHHDHGHSGEGLGLLTTLLWALKLDTVPMTIVLSLVFFWAWLASHLAMHYVVGYEAHWSIEVGLFVAAIAVALPLTSLSVRPIVPLFRSHPGQRRAALLGKVVTVDTSVVDAGFGTAKAEDGGAGLIVQIRCDVPNSLKRGDRALVLSFDEAREVYEVTPIDDLIPIDKSTRPD
jgi:hypothetical protein